MYRIGIIGDAAEYVLDIDFTKKNVNNVLELISFQYRYGQKLVFNIAGDTGIGEWSADFCNTGKLKYHLFVPYPVENMKDLWYKEQYEALQRNYNKASGVTISSSKYDHSVRNIQISENYRNLIDSSAFIIVFWNGMKQGPIAQALRYSLANNKLAVNGLDELKMIIQKDL